ncbi:MAG: CoA transferase [Acidimicrobiia bacterium]
MSERPLDGIVVAEFGNLIAAPYASMLLADLGARVIKVETTKGDLGRQFGPFQDGESVFYMSVNRGKESLSVDPGDWVAKRVLDNLVRRCDVLIHNLRHGAMERMGLGADRAVELNPTLIYASVSAFGAEGPYAERAGIDVVFQGESGMISISGHAKDGPRKTATTIGDYVAGTNAALAISAALVERPRRARRIDVSLRDGLMAVQSGWNALAFNSGSQPERTGTASPYLAPNQVFEGSDRPFTLAVVSDRHFEILCRELKRPDLLESYPTNDQRMADRDSLARKLARVFKTESAGHWVNLLGAAGLPVGRVLSIEESFADPQAQHNGMSVVFEHRAAGTVRVTGSPIHVDREPALAERPPATLGQDTRSLLHELGVDDNTVEELIASGRAVAS